MKFGKKQIIYIDNITIEATNISGTSNIGIGTTITEKSYSSQFKLKTNINSKINIKSI